MLQFSISALHYYAWHLPYEVATLHRTILKPSSNSTKHYHSPAAIVLAMHRLLACQRELDTARWPSVDIQNPWTLAAGLRAAHSVEERSPITSNDFVKRYLPDCFVFSMSIMLIGKSHSRPCFSGASSFGGFRDCPEHGREYLSVLA